MLILEKDVVMGTFTNKETYLPALCGSIRQFLSHVMFCLQLDDAPINKNFNALREKFKQTGKRFWLFLDDDIKFVHPDTLKIALETMIRNKYALVGVYSTFDPEFKCDPSTLQEAEVTWFPGYFQLVDSHLVGDVMADMNLPCPNTAIDTSYCTQIKQRGYKLGIAPAYVYHKYKPWNHENTPMVEPTNKYLLSTYGQQYFDWFVRINNILGPLPISTDELLKNNTQKILQWQKENYVLEEGKLKLHMGCGNQMYPGYINCDVDGDVDQIYDMTEKVTFVEEGTVDHITCQHALEHIPYRAINGVLKEWHRLLKVGGTIDIGMPDIELVAKEFLEGPEEKRWNHTIFRMYGQQGTTLKHSATLTEDDPIDENQFHKGGLTKSRMCFLLTGLGFEILDSYNYDGFGNASLFVLARKVSNV